MCAVEWSLSLGDMMGLYNDSNTGGLCSSVDADLREQQ